jgi:hypothetical protein
MELTPFAPRPGGRRERRRRAALGPGLAVAFLLVVILGALYVLGSWGDEDSGGEREANTVETATPTPKKGKKKNKKERAAPTRVTLQIVPTGVVSVCLVDAGGKALISNEVLEGGAPTRRYRSKRFQVSFGNGQARMRVAGRTIDVPDRSTPVGYDVRPGKKPRELPESRRPTCT